MDFIVLKGNTHDKKELAPITGLTSGLEATAAGSNQFSTGYVEITDADGQTQKVATLTTDVVNFRYINNQIQLTVRKLMGKEVKESYILPLTIPGIPQYFKLSLPSAANGTNITAQVERNPQTREQRVIIQGFPFPTELNTDSEKNTLYVSFSRYRFASDSILTETFGKTRVQAKSTEHVLVGFDDSGSNGMVVLRGIY